MKTNKRLLQEVKKYIEATEVTIDGEWGSCRDLKKLIAMGDMPVLYWDVCEALGMLRGKRKTKAVLLVNGKAIFDYEPGDCYMVTGVDCAGKRFKRVGGWAYISGINAWQGTLWLVRRGKRYRIRSIIN